MKKNRSVRAPIFTSIVFAITTLAYAAGESSATTLDSSFRTVGSAVNSFTSNVVNAFVTLFATAALAVFFFGIVQYIWGKSGGQSEKVKTGNSFMVWGMLALFVMFSVWGIIFFFQKIFTIENDRTIYIPDIQLRNGGGDTPSPSPFPVAPATLPCENRNEIRDPAGNCYNPDLGAQPN